MILTIAYMTARRDPKIEWFIDSLYKQTDGDMCYTSLVVVDFWKESRALEIECPFKRYVAPKPCVWQGEHRLTKDNWFAASNARNTALCLAPDGFIAYVDDLSVLMPGWLDCVREAMAHNYIALGTYEKRRNMVVENGVLISSDTGSTDSRLATLKDLTKPHHVDGGWCYGASLAGPVEAFLSVNGWPEDLCDSLGSEDSCMGVALYNAGHKLMFDPRMKTIESEELHFTEKPFKRCDYHFENGVAVEGGNNGDDKSHRALNIALSSKYFPNSFGEGGIRALRQRVLNGEPFPIPQAPQHEWFSGKLISEL